jgi:hypothetical protein
MSRMPLLIALVIASSLSGADAPRVLIIGDSIAARTASVAVNTTRCDTPRLWPQSLQPSAKALRPQAAFR